MSLLRTCQTWIPIRASHVSNLAIRKLCHLLWHRIYACFRWKWSTPPKNISSTLWYTHIIQHYVKTASFHVLP